MIVILEKVMFLVFMFTCVTISLGTCTPKHESVGMKQELNKNSSTCSQPAVSSSV